MKRSVIVLAGIAAAIFVAVIVVAVLPRGGTVSGTVVGPEEVPVVDGLVTASYREWAFRDGELLWDNPVIFETRTDDDGRFTLGYDGRNSVRLRVFASGYQTFEGDITGDAAMSIELVPSEAFSQPGPRERRRGEDWVSYYCDELDRTTRFVGVEFQAGLVDVAEETFEVAGVGFLHPVRGASPVMVESWVYQPSVNAAGLQPGACSDFVVLDSQPALLSIPELRLELPLD